MLFLSLCLLFDKTTKTNKNNNDILQFQTTMLNILPIKSSNSDQSQ